MFPCSCTIALVLSVVRAHISVRSGIFLKTFSSSSLAVPDSRAVFRSSHFLKCLVRCLREGDGCRGWQLVGDDEECQLELLVTVDDGRIGESVKEKYQKHVTCKSDPCLNRGSCINRTPSVLSRAAYICRCLCGSCGRRCETLNFGQQLQSAIVGKNLFEKDGISVEDCMRECLLNPECNSFDYGNRDRKCYLNKGMHDSESMEHFDDIDYYYPNCTCPNV